jgi:hypothetical protein
LKTMFVNPGRRNKRRSAKKRNPRKVKRNTRRRSAKRNPRKASRKMIVNPRRRRTSRRRRNASVTPFVRSNPLILRNPRSIRRRRRNPGMGGGFTMKNILDKGLSYGGGSALGAGINMIALSKIEDKWFRNGARLAAAIGGGILLKGDLGAAAAGATLYPMWQELAVMLKVISGPKPFLPYPDGSQTVKAASASLDELSADLQDVLDEAAVDEIYDNYN